MRKKLFPFSFSFSFFPLLSFLSFSFFLSFFSFLSFFPFSSSSPPLSSFHFLFFFGLDNGCRSSSSPRVIHPPRSPPSHASRGNPARRSNKPRAPLHLAGTHSPAHRSPYSPSRDRRRRPLPVPLPTATNDTVGQWAGISESLYFRVAL